MVSTLKDDNYVESVAKCLKAVIYTMENAEENEKIYKFLLGLMCELVPYINYTLSLTDLSTAEVLIGLVACFANKFASHLVQTFCLALSDAFVMPILNFFFANMEGVT